MNTVPNAAIYCRLSRDDNNKNDVSMSIANQKAILTNYVNEKGWKIYDTYIDDGISGTTFDRPRFKDMIRDIESGLINIVITKDLSRLGRNYIETGQYTDFYFPNNNVRYIALNDGIDTFHDDNDIAPFKNILNEMYAKDISRKVRSTKKLLAQEGKFANSRAPYGYKKSPEDKHKLVIDENASQIVEFIFSQYLKGETGRSIADKLNRKNIPTPNNYYYQSINKPNPYIKDKNKWSSGTIMGIIKNPAYYGAIANCKRTVKSFKNKNVVSLPKEQWVVVENMHQPIIPKEQWEAAQKINIDNKHEGLKRRCNGKMNIFSGLLKCADCGGNMIFNTKYYKSYTKEYYRCSTYMSKGKMACTHHSIDYNIIYRAVMDDIKKYAALSEEDEEKLTELILNMQTDFQSKNINKYEENIRKTKNRIREIEGLIQAAFEEKISGTITDVIFRCISEKYEKEYEEQQKKLSHLEMEYESCRSAKNDVSNWLKKIKLCCETDVLSRDLLVSLIDHIDVSEAYEENGEKSFDISITYTFGQQNTAKKPYALMA